MVMAFALLLTQCRKPEVKFPTPSAADEGTTVSMTVTAGPGSKTDITAAGAIKWSEGDKLYVGFDGKYVGCLEIKSGVGTPTGWFSGTLTLDENVTGEQTFHFFYLGSTERTLEVGATEATVSFASQNIYNNGGNLKNASAQHVGYGSASGTVKDGVVTGINVTLVSKVALARFSFKKGGTGYSNALTLKGNNIYNSMTVDFNGTLTGTKTGDGKINLTNTTSSEKYVMLVPVGTGSETLSFAGEGFEGSTTLGSGIEPNKFYGREVAIEVKPTPFEFSVSGTTTVEFAPGNLWYGKADGEETAAFHFEANQWGFEDSWNSSHVSHFYWSKDVAEAVKDEFNWDQEMDTKDNFFTNSDATTASSSFTVDGETGVWRTLSKDEWNYLLSINPEEYEQQEGYGRVNALSLSKWSAVKFGESGPTVNGLIIMPDGWDGALTPTTDYTTWQSLASSGVVFLPAAGYRYGTVVSDVGSCGYYWSSTPYEGYEDYAYDMLFFSGSVSTDYDNRYLGDAVRLVR